MPVSIQYDLTKYPIFGDLYRKGLAKGLRKGRKEGLEEGLKEGRQEGLKEGRRKGKQEAEDKGREKAARELLAVALNKRFGRIPAYAAKRIDQMSAAQAKKTLSASFDAKRLRDLFPATRAR